MVFSSLLFLCLFLPLVIIGYYLSPKRFKNYWLLLASFIFYSWGEPQYIVLMFISIFANYVFGIGVHKFSKSLKKLFLVLAILTNIGVLGYYKYSVFLITTINDFFGTSFHLDQLPLPIGISFYTFQAMSYVIDVYRNDGKIQKNPFQLALYIALFPQLVAGPIVRYQSIAEQIHHRTHSIPLFISGIQDFSIGLAKKVIIANQLALVADEIFASPTSEIGTSLAWVGIIAYSLQIFFDFSGYSQMAIGLGKMFGFDFPKNFDYPYISKSISEFWRRWHITLGSWFRDYIYIPLGGNKVSTWKVYRNLFIVWFATGLWHGASLNFIAWGLYYGVFIALEKAFLGNYLKRTPLFLQHCYVILLFVIGWVFFRAETLPEALAYLGLMFGFGNELPLLNDYVVFYFKQYWFEYSLGILISTPIVPFLSKRVALPYVNALAPVLCFLLLVYCITVLTTSAYNPFIYFRF